MRGTRAKKNEAEGVMFDETILLLDHVSTEICTSQFINPISFYFMSLFQQSSLNWFYSYCNSIYSNNRESGGCE